jgi:hypothetical protein
MNPRLSYWIAGATPTHPPNVGYLPASPAGALAVDAGAVDADAGVEPDVVAGVEDAGGGGSDAHPSALTARSPRTSEKPVIFIIEVTLLGRSAG